MTNSVKAFTLPEVVVALALTSIVLSMAYLAWGNMARFAQRYRQKSAHEGDFLQIGQALHSDLGKQGQLWASEDGWYFQWGDTVASYTLADSLLVRQGTQHAAADTFACRVLRADKRFEGQEADGQRRLLDEINLEVLVQERPYSIHLEKHYDAYTLMKFNREEQP